MFFSDTKGRGAGGRSAVHPTYCIGHSTDGFARLRASHGCCGGTSNRGGRSRDQATSTNCGRHPTDGFASLRPGRGGCGGMSNRGGRIRLHFHSRMGMKIKESMRSSPHRATVHRTVACYFSNPFPPKHKKTNPYGLVFLWWGRTDSNHRSETQQIYSLSPLATRELPHIHFLARWSR